jgi:diacylglycerol kinase
MTTSHDPRPRGLWPRWHRRFADAFDGSRIGVRTQESLWVHLVFAILVPIVAVVLKLEAWRWCVLLLCMAMVISMELMNSAIERLVKTLHPEHDSGLAAALHLSAAAVLVTAIASVIVGCMVIAPDLLRWLH